MLGKCIAGLFGYLLGRSLGLGFWGLLLGVWVGHRFDRGLAGLSAGGGQQSFGSGVFGFYGHTGQIQEAFFATTFRVMGHIAKADGRISEREIQAARAAMRRMRLNVSQKREAIKHFQEGKQPDFSLEETLAHFRRLCRGRVLLFYMFVEIQIQAAYADGSRLSAVKRERLRVVCEQLGLGAEAFEGMNSRCGAEEHYGHQYRYQQQRQRSQQGAAWQSQGTSLQEAYQVLGVSSSVSDDALKKAYRRLMNQHHPDKLIAKGLPESMIKIATEKTQAIKAAYEQIRAARG